MRDLKISQNLHRQQEENKVENNVDDSGGLKKGLVVDAGAFGVVKIPRLWDGIALKDDDNHPRDSEAGADAGDAKNHVPEAVVGGEAQVKGQY